MSVQTIVSAAVNVGKSLSVPETQNAVNTLLDAIDRFKQSANDEVVEHIVDLAHDLKRYSRNPKQFALMQTRLEHIVTVRL
jgi:hypothetical protein